MAVISLLRQTLWDDLLKELEEALKQFDDDTSVGAIVLTGCKRFFSAGVDIRKMQNLTYVDWYMQNLLGKHFCGFMNCMLML